jgi:hypothetical protein
VGDLLDPVEFVTDGIISVLKGFFPGASVPLTAVEKLLPAGIRWVQARNNITPEDQVEFQRELHARLLEGAPEVTQ